MSRFNVKKVAVLGAGVMGAQIAAHLVNVKVPVVLFDLPAKEGPKNGTVLRAIENLKKLKPAPLAAADDAVLIEPANYEDDLKKLKECDLIIEAIAERMDWKSDLYAKIAPHVAKHTILASNTSGPVDHPTQRSPARAAAPPLLRHPLFQPAALHVPGGADRHAQHPAAGDGPAGEF
jgi:3-hydroxyacyl-CoA dehydrogenase